MLELWETEPNQALERTAAERLGFDMVGFIDIIRHSLSALPAAVAQLLRSAPLTRMAE